MSDSNSINILLAEDNAQDVKFGRMALVQAHLECGLRVVRDGAEAISLTEGLDRDRKPTGIDLMLLDLALSKQDGAAGLRSLRSTERSAQPPVAALTRSSAITDQQTAQKNAAADFFSKPITLEEYIRLRIVVWDILARSRRDLGIGRAEARA